MHERSLGGSDELGPALVDVLAQRRGGVRDLAVDDEVDQILRLVLLDRAAQKAELARRLLAALAEVTLVEREALRMRPRFSVDDQDLTRMRSAASDETFTIAPPPAFAISGTA